MKRMLAIGTALFLATSLASAQGPGYGPGPGGPGSGYGPGMMGGGYGPGAGRGMMGGYGGYSGGYGPGGGMMGGYGRLGALDLTDEQQDKIFAIQEENRQKNWDTMGQMRSEQFKLQRMYRGNQVDPNAVAEQQKKVDELRRQMLKSRLEARNQIEAVLTPEQRKQVRQFGPWWAGEDAE